MGHAGTLDPLATGLLIICTSRYTKKINEFMGQDKIYEGEITLGSVTDSYDLEHPPRDFCSVEHLSKDDVEAAMKNFTGDILQMPPMHSAIKKDGKRLYKYARKGQKVEVQPRPIHIESFEMLDYEKGKLRFRTHCSTGTYIRSLAHELGEQLQVGGHLSALRRTHIGTYDVHEAHPLDELVKYYEDNPEA